MSKVKDIFPADKISHVLTNAAQEIETGIVIGYNPEGELVVYGGGLIDGRRPVAKDWLWMVDSFKQKLLNGDYSG